MNITLFSFYDITKGKYPSKKELINELEQTDKYNYEYTYGLGYRNPTTHHAPITKEKAIQIIKNASFVEVFQIEPDKIHVNEYSANDMW